MARLVQRPLESLIGWRERMRALTFEVIVRALFGVTERERIERLRGALVPRHGTPVRIRSRLVSGGARPRAQSATSPR